MNLKSTRTLTVISVLSAVASVLMLFDFPILFMFPEFLKLDFSDLPALIGAFTFGPLAGVAVELVKNLIHLTVTSTGGVGELANFIVGAALVVPAGLIYSRKKTRGGALFGMGAGVLTMALAGALANYFLIIPFYSKLMPIDTIISICSALIPAVRDKLSMILLTFVPFNLFKGILISLLTFLLYKKLSPLLHGRR